MTSRPPALSTRDRILRLWRRNRWLTLSFLLAAGFALFFTVRAVVFFVYWHNHVDEPLAGWMTIRYIAHSYHLDPLVLHTALDLQPGVPDRRPLIEISRDKDQSMDETTRILLDAIARDRDAHRPPLAPPAKP